MGIRKWDSKDRWFSTGEIVSSRGHLATFGNSFGCHNWELLTTITNVGVAVTTVTIGI